jgi:hypothetical protein
MSRLNDQTSSDIRVVVVTIVMRCDVLQSLPRSALFACQHIGCFLIGVKTEERMAEARLKPAEFIESPYRGTSFRRSNVRRWQRWRQPPQQQQQQYDFDDEA